MSELADVTADELTDAVMAAQPVSTPPDYILDAAKVIAEYDPVLRAMSPPCKLTPTVAVRLLTSIRAGAHYETACAKARIAYSTFVTWRNRADDEGDEGPFAALMVAVKLAEADAELESLSDVRVAAKNPKFWAAGMTFLERRHPDRWRRPDAGQTVNVQVGVALGVQVSDETRRSIVPVVEALSLPVITQNQAQLCDSSRGGDNGLSPTAESLSAPSPVPETAVSEDNREAKATPNRGVSPSNVA